MISRVHSVDFDKTHFEYSFKNKTFLWMRLWLKRLSVEKISILLPETFHPIVYLRLVTYTLYIQILPAIQ